MTCLNTTTRVAIIARITKYETLLESAYDAIDSGGSSDIGEYSFDSGEGSQRVKYRSLADLQKYIEWLESRIGYLYRRLNGTGLVNLNLRRKGYNRVVRTI